MSRESPDTKTPLHSSDDFSTAYELHVGPIYRFLFWRTRDGTISEDLTSAVFMKAWQARSRFSGGSVKAWLYTIARHTLIDHWRQRSERPVEDIEQLSEAHEPGFDARLNTTFNLERLRIGLGSLPVIMQHVIRLRFIEGRSCRMTARALRLSESNVRVLQYRALKKLREYMQ